MAFSLGYDETWRRKNIIIGKLGPRLLIVLLALLVVSFTFTPDMVMAQRTYTYSLSVSVDPSGGGRVTPESGTYDSGTEVTLYATPSSGYEFDYWSGDASGTDLSVRIVMELGQEDSSLFY